MTALRLPPLYLTISSVCVLLFCCAGCQRVRSILLTYIDYSANPAVAPAIIQDVVFCRKRHAFAVGSEKDGGALVARFLDLFHTNRLVPYIYLPALYCCGGSSVGSATFRVRPARHCFTTYCATPSPSVYHYPAPPPSQQHYTPLPTCCRYTFPTRAAC